MQICKKCGAENEDGTVICSVCKTPLGEKIAQNKPYSDMFEKYNDYRLGIEEDEPDAAGEKNRAGARRGASRRSGRGGRGGRGSGAERAPGGSAFVRSVSRREAAEARAPRGGAAGFLRRHFLKIAVGVVAAALVIVVIALIAGRDPAPGLLDTRPHYLVFTQEGETAEGAVALKGLLDEKGDILLSAQYQNVLGEVDDGLFAVIGQNSKIGVVNQKGNEVIACDFLSVDATYGFREGLWAVCTGETWGYVDKKGNFKISPVFEAASAFSEGLAPVKQDGLWGYVNKDGELTITPAFEEAYPFDNGMALVKQGGKYGFIDSNGLFEIEPSFDEAYPYFTEDLCLVRVGTRYGFIDKNGEYAINPQFDDAQPFSEGLAAVELDGKVGYVNTRGKYVVEPTYDGLRETSMFYDGYATVYSGSEAFVIDKRGRRVTSEEMTFTEVSHLFDDFFLVNENGRYGLLNKNGKEYVSEPVFGALAAVFRDTVVFYDDQQMKNIFTDRKGQVVATSKTTIVSTTFYSSASKEAIAVQQWIARPRQDAAQ